MIRPAYSYDNCGGAPVQSGWHRTYGNRDVWAPYLVSINLQPGDWLLACAVMDDFGSLVVVGGWQ